MTLRSLTLLVVLHAIVLGACRAAIGDDAPRAETITSTLFSDSGVWQPLSHDSGTSSVQPTAFQAEGMTFPVPTADDGDGSTDYQDAPGDDYLNSEYARQYPRLPSYYFNPDYYDTWDIGARPLPDYAPPGFEPRDYESAPGEPEFEWITPPTPLPVGEPAGLVTRGMYPGSFLVPGTNTSFRLRGFVRMTGLLDFAPIGSADSFVTNTIPVPQQIGQNVNMTARPSRFSLESWTPTNYCDWNVHTFIEGDFFNGPAQAAGGGGNPFRLRHAFIDFGYFRVGQQNSVFMDGTNWPSLVDFQGPNSWANQRQPVARMTIPIVDGVYWATSVERCFSDITTNGQGSAVQDVPDFATHLRLQGDRGSHVQVAGLFRTIGYRTDDEEVTRRMGLGVNGNVVFHPWAWWMGTDPVHEEDPSGLTRSRILMQANWGPGLGRYVNDLAGQGLDAQVDPITGAFDLVEATAWNASYEHWYNSQWLSNFTYSQVSVDSAPGQPGGTYDSAKYVAASLWWIPIPRMSLGMEYLVGEREDLDGDSARARRFNALVQYNF
ncbi:DcaP family trimeric outer membrane transporter [Aeoliella sp. SH292]|uniref:DcaP family trimeric outer membrane transporter n=1 Tax=Aeoliella sp. SH292 TaxID=3454464 RepID=UPI003F9B9037